MANEKGLVGHVVGAVGDVVAIAEHVGHAAADIAAADALAVGAAEAAVATEIVVAATHNSGGLSGALHEVSQGAADMAASSLARRGISARGSG